MKQKTKEEKKEERVIKKKEEVALEASFESGKKLSLSEKERSLACCVVAPCAVCGYVQRSKGSGRRK